MADLVVRRNNGGNLQPTLTRELEPLRIMRDLLRWDPFQEMAPIWPTEIRAINFSPAFEVKETKDTYVFRADVPGLKEQDIDVTITGNRLIVSGNRNEEKEERGDTYYTCERTYGTFSRSFTLPEGTDADHIRADLKHGVLTIALPKLPQVQAKKVAISSAEKAPKA